MFIFLWMNLSCRHNWLCQLVVRLVSICDLLSQQDRDLLVETRILGRFKDPDQRNKG